MRVLSLMMGLTTLAASLVFTAQAQAGEESLLVDSINQYRSQVQRCGNQGSQELPPLASDTRLVLPVNSVGDLQQALARAAYPMVNVQAISLSGPRNAEAAMKAVRESFCRVVLDPQFIDIGVSNRGQDWRIVLARPLLTSGLGETQTEGKKVLDLINTARQQPRQCGGQAFAATTPLSWNEALANAAAGHARNMANGNFFDHLDHDGRTPGDRAELAGYIGQQIGENIAAGMDTPRKVVDGWLASPGHCANLMNPQFREMGAAYAMDPKSDAGIYWTGLFGVQQQ
ncbi:CAP domain-containing protein [Pseudomonas sp. D6002]|uniref:CAP domain-containing protein n=1 Tax=unclassified Pseudomonas TaxID=196821 RepID=UPI0015A46C76|nr:MULTISPECIES: CAP domain-containing protein [unclassified Pseudomonas]NVZ94416.1 CAP domain-containing protein [Pseudomonas sp. B6001]NWB16551.1 CAP domain-containing protein [Pseudomonas sp. D6002]